MKDDFENLVASCLVDGRTEKIRITFSDAAYTLNAWKEEGGVLEGPEDITPEDFALAWNAALEVV